MAGLAQVALPVPLSVVMAIADDHSTVAVRTAYAIRPAMLTYKLEAFGFVQQAREVDHVGYGHRCVRRQGKPIHRRHQEPIHPA